VGHDHTEGEARSPTAGAAALISATLELRVKVGVFAAATAIGLGGCSATADRSGADNATATAPAGAPETTALEVATGFVDAYGAFDVEQAITYLAADADIAPLIGSMGTPGVQGTLEEFRLFISLLEAQGYQQMLDSCEEQAAAVRCTFDFHLIRSDEVGLGPFSGSYFDLTVRDGQIARASKQWGTEEFSPLMWEPFASWVSTAYPEDAPVMYAEGNFSAARLSNESIRLWEQLSREYVAVETAN
jgi:hypothetical protein